MFSNLLLTAAEQATCFLFVGTGKILCAGIYKKRRIQHPKILSFCNAENMIQPGSSAKINLITEFYIAAYCNVYCFIQKTKAGTSLGF